MSEQIKFFIQSIRESDDGASLFIENDTNWLALAKNKEPFNSLEVGQTYLFTGDWKQGKKRKYFNISNLVTEEPPKTPQNAPESKSIPPKPESKLIDKAKELGAIRKDDKRDRAMALSYAKDMVCTGKIELKDLNKYADQFLEYIIK